MSNACTHIVRNAMITSMFFTHHNVGCLVCMMWCECYFWFVLDVSIIRNNSKILLKWKFMIFGTYPRGLAKTLAKSLALSLREVVSKVHGEVTFLLMMFYKCPPLIGVINLKLQLKLCQNIFIFNFVFTHYLD